MCESVEFKNKINFKNLKTYKLTLCRFIIKIYSNKSKKKNLQVTIFVIIVIIES